MKSGFPLATVVFAMLIGSAVLTHADTFTSASITKVTNKVELIPPGKQPEKADVGSIVKGSMGVKTGLDSRVELMFPDKTLARLGSNTLFSFDQGTRSVELGNGILLLQVPKNIGGAKITTAPVTAAITGTTVLVEFHRTKSGGFRMTVIEGTVKLTSNSTGKTTTVGPGKTVFFSSKTNQFSTPKDADIGHIMRNSNLVNMGKLGNQQEIDSVIAAQKALAAQGITLELVDTDNNNDNDILNQDTLQTQGTLPASAIGPGAINSGGGNPPSSL